VAGCFCDFYSICFSHTTSTRRVIIFNTDKPRSVVWPGGRRNRFELDFGAFHHLPILRLVRLFGVRLRRRVFWRQTDWIHTRLYVITYYISTVVTAPCLWVFATCCVCIADLFPSRHSDCPPLDGYSISVFFIRYEIVRGPFMYRFRNHSYPPLQLVPETDNNYRFSNDNLNVCPRHPSRSTCDAWKCSFLFKYSVATVASRVGPWKYYDAYFVDFE